MARGRGRSGRERGEKPGKGKGRHEPTYDTHDEALEGGIEAEEKGERWAVGDKARRFYEKAYELYRRAASFSETPDSLYNAARVLYLLSTAFYLAPSGLSTLKESIFLYRRASSSLLSTTLSEPSSQATQGQAGAPTEFGTDITFNLATALQTLGEWMDELELREMNAVDSGPSFGLTPKELLLEAARLFEQVARDQYALVTFDRAPESDCSGGSDDGMSEISPDTDYSHQTSGAEPNVGSSSSGPTATAWESTLTTPSTILDTLLSLHSCASSILSLANSPSELSQAKEVAATAFASVQDLYSAYPHLQAERSAEVSLAGETWRIAEASKGISLGLAASEDAWTTLRQEQSAALDQLAAIAASSAPALASSAPGQQNDAAKEAKEFAIRVHCELGDARSTVAWSIFRRALQSSLQNNPLQEADLALVWTLASQSVQAYNAALQATSASPSSSTLVVGSSGTTPTSLTRSSILRSLSVVSILRAHPLLANLPKAQGKTASLLENAKVYARRACEESGCAWMFRAGTDFPSHQMVAPASLFAAGPEPLRAACDSVFHLLRAYSFAEVNSAPNADPGAAGAPQQGMEVRTLARVLMAISKAEEAGRLAAGPGGIRRWVEEREEEEGEWSARERVWWSALAESVEVDLQRPPSA